VRSTIALLAAVALLGSLTGGGAASGRRLSVALVLDAGSTPTENDAVGQAYRAFVQSVRRFGLDGRVAFADPQKDPTALLDSLARRRYDLILSPVLDKIFVESAAARYPDERFFMPAFPHSSLSRPSPNVEGAVFHSEQAAYLAGYLAALVAERSGGRAVSSIGGFKFPAVDEFIAGYEAGARRADPGIATLHAYAGDFFDRSKCRALALDQITRGSRVVFPVAGFCSLGALQAAQAKGVWGVGVDVDESALGGYILTSALKQNGRSISDAIRLLVDGKLRTGGDLVYNLANGGVGLGRISPRVPRTLVARLDTIRREIVAGRIVVPTTLR
jgi:basic membrane protein A